LIKFGLFIDQTNTYARKFCSSNGIVRSFEKYLFDQMSQTKTNVSDKNKYLLRFTFWNSKTFACKISLKKSWKSFNENEKHSNFRLVLTDLTVQLPDLMIIMIIMIIIPVMITVTNIPISVIVILITMKMIMIMILITMDMIMIRGKPTLCF